MITLKELNPKGYKLTEEQEKNLPILHERINKVRSLYAKPMIVTSSIRSMDDHKRIYLSIAQKKGIKNPRIPMGSLHLKAAAVDIYDPKQELQAWCLANVKLLEEIGLWMEDFSATKNWCHFQIFPPASGRRFFLP